MKLKSVPLSIGGRDIAMVTEEPSSDDPNIKVVSVVTNNLPEDFLKEAAQLIQEVYLSGARCADKESEYDNDWVLGNDASPLDTAKKFLSSAYQKGVEDERERMQEKFRGIEVIKVSVELTDPDTGKTFEKEGEDRLMYENDVLKALETDLTQPTTKE